MTDIAPQVVALAQFPWNRTLTSHELYLDLVSAELGLSVGSPLVEMAAAIFESVDSFGELAPPRPGLISSLFTFTVLAFPCHIPFFSHLLGSLSVQN